MPGNISFFYECGNMPSLADALTETENGTIITIEVTARSSQNAFPAGYNGWRKTIGCRVTAPASGGKANRAVITLIAQTLNVSENTVQIQSGTTSQIKKVIIFGMKKADLLSKLQSLV
jgi:uncharacterized protein